MLSNKEICDKEHNKLILCESSPSNLSPNHESNIEFFGPALPSHLLEKNMENTKNNPKFYGPVLPHSFRNLEENCKEAFNKDEEVGKNIKNYQIIGPDIPDHLKSTEQNEEEEETKTDISLRTVDSECDDYFGPSVNLMSTDNSLDHSIKLIKSECINEKVIDFKKKRETWMLELPEKKLVSLDKCKRYFKTRSYRDEEDDRSVWTNIPTEKEKQKDKKKEKDYLKFLKMKKLEERDKEMNLLIEKAKKKQPNSSLLEMHLKKLKKKKKEEKKLEKDKAVPKMRRPFDRNIDLEIHRFDENKKRSILNSARFLNDRYASGESKFL